MADLILMILIVSVTGILAWRILLAEDRLDKLERERKDNPNG